jgi:serine/threonine protein kinase
VNLIQQACGSLAEAHREGLVHRDIKPANLFACRLGLEYDFLKVLDFGLVRTAVELAEGEGARSFVGTPSYASPEAARGLPVDHRSDIYSLGCVLYWLLTRCQVFFGDTTGKVLRAHAERVPDRPSLLSGFEVPAELDDVVLACLAKDPADRPASAEELRERLRRVPLAEPWGPREAEGWWKANPRESPDDRSPDDELTASRDLMARSWLREPPGKEDDTLLVPSRKPAQRDEIVRVEVAPHLADLIPDYLEQCRRDVKTMGEALEAGDLDLARRLVHSLRVNGASYGFDGLAEISAAMEAAAKTGDVQGVAQQLPKLTAYLGRIQLH